MDKRITKTQKALKQTMLNLLKSKSLEAITVTDICEEAEIVRRTFYAHYTDKYALAESIMNDYINDFEAICDFKKTVSLQEGNIKWFLYLHEHRDIFKIIFKSALSSLFNHKIEKIIQHEINNKLNSNLLNSSQLTKATLLKFLTSAILGVMTDFILSKDEDYEFKAQEVLILLSPYTNEASTS